MMAVVTQDPSVVAVTRKEDAYRFFTETGASRAPSWRNEITLRSIEYAPGYLPAAYTPYISPTPFLLVLAEGDALPMDVAIAAYKRAGEPKRLVVLKCGHYDVSYRNVWTIGWTCLRVVLSSILGKAFAEPWLASIGIVRIFRIAELRSQISGLPVAEVMLALGPHFPVRKRCFVANGQLRSPLAPDCTVPFGPEVSPTLPPAPVSKDLSANDRAFNGRSMPLVRQSNPRRTLGTVRPSMRVSCWLAQHQLFPTQFDLRGGSRWASIRSRCFASKWAGLSSADQIASGTDVSVPIRSRSGNPAARSS